MGDRYSSYENKCKDVSDYGKYPYGVFFKPDGLKMYIMGNYDKAVYQYSLSTAWDISTASYEDKYKFVDAQDTSPYGVTFSSDGSKMYMMGGDSDKVYQYTISTAWDVSSATYDTKSKYVGSEDTDPIGLSFKTDGLKMYVVGNINDSVYQYNLSTAWDISTASYEGKYKNVSSEDTYPMGVSFKTDGLKMYVVGNINDSVYQYNLSTAWDISTASYEDKYKYVGSEDTYPTNLFFKPDGNKAYIMGGTNEKVYQYLLPVPSVNALFFGTNF